MIPQNTDIFCIIVHYGAQQPTERLVSSLLTGSVDPAGIVVIDHGPVFGNLAPLDGRVQIVIPERNEGYAGGVNIGLGVLMGRGVSVDSLVIVMNNDIEVSQDSLKQIRQWREKNPEATMAGIKGGTVNLFTGRTHISSSSKLKATSYKLVYIHGSLLAAPLSVFLKVHFPDTYFLYWEDVVYSRELVRHGVPLKLMSGVDVKHPEEKPLRGDRLYYLVRNGAVFLERQTPFLWRVYWRVVNASRAGYHQLFTPEPKRSRILRALRDARKQVSGKYES